ncbi:MAG: amino acid adenylation domain-containing protein, partial [Acidobacteriota bacterium]
MNAGDLEAASDAAGVGLAELLLALFAVLLYRYTGEADLLIGCRPGAGLGELWELLPIRFDLSGDPVWRLLCERTAKALGEATEHRGLPLEALWTKLGWRVGPGSGSGPRFDAVFEVATQGAEGAGRGDGEVRERPPITADRSSPHGLVLRVVPGPGALGCGLVYRPEILDDRAAHRFLEHYRNLLRGVVERPGQRLSRVPLLGRNEANELLVERNRTTHPFPWGSCLHELIADQAERTPDAVALVVGKDRLSYGELAGRSAALAERLTRRGVGPETRVAVCLERTLELPVTLLAILRAGGAYVPMDPEYPRERLRVILEDSGASLLVTREGLLGRFPDPELPILRIGRPESAAGDGDAEVIAAVRPLPENLAYVIYTSGSTGRPKGVAVRHSSVVALAAWADEYFGAGPYRGTLATTSICFDVSISEIFVPLTLGGTVILARDVLDLPSLAAANEVTLVSTVPSAASALVRDGGLPATVRTLVLAGEALSASLVRTIYRETGVETVFNLYGPTEDTVFSTAAAMPREASGVSPIGRPINNSQVYVADAAGNLLPAGLPGELLLGGCGLARGYLSRPRLTAERFVPHPWATRPGARLYRTGDLVRYRPDREMEFLGRMDHQVKVRGFRIEMGEVEATLERHPAVERALLVAQGEGEDRRLIAYVVPEPGAEAPGSGELRELVGGALPTYMIPARFVPLRAFPLTANGKIDRDALPAPDGEPVVEEIAPPRTPLEETVASIWSAVLGQVPIGVHDSFFDRGGHSLRAYQVVSRLRDAVGVELPVTALLEDPTVEALARRVGSALGIDDADPGPPLQPMGRAAESPLSYPQQGLWFLAQIAPDSPFYNVPLALDLSGPLAVRALTAGLGEVLRRHEVLRASFDAAAGGAVQRVASEVTVALPCVDLSGLPAPARDAEATRAEAAVARTPFDLSRGPLLRALLLRRGPRFHTLAITVHHIVFDGVSVDLFLSELATLYGASVEGRPSTLEELPLQYTDFAVWQRRRIRGAELSRLLDHWRARLEGAPPVQDLPGDRPRPAVLSYRGGDHSFHLPPARCEELRALAHGESATLFMALLAAFEVLVFRLTERADQVIGSPVAKRGRSELEGLIGLFVNMLPLRTRIDANGGFRGLLAAVRETALAAYTHQDLPFELLVGELAPERDLSRNPLFQIALVFEGDIPDELALGPNLALRYREVGLRSSQFDLTLHLANRAGGLDGRLVYSTELFDATTVRRLAGQLERLLGTLVADPDRPIGSVSLLSTAERRQLLVEWNRTATDYPRHETVPELFAAVAAAVPDRVALVSGRECLTYGELQRRGLRLARRLRDLGIGPDRLAGLMVERSLEMVVGILGILEAGGAYLPLDPAYPAERLALMLDEARPPVLLTTEALADRVPEVDGARLLLLDRVDEDRVDLEPPSGPGPDPLGLVYVMYTSGSTGRPKGVAAVHRGVVRLVRDTDFAELEGEHTFLQLSPSSFDASTLEIWGPLLNGGRLMVMPPGQPSLDDVAAAIGDGRVDTLWLTAGLFHLMVQERLDALSPLSQLLAGGDVLSVPHVERVLAGLPDCRLINGYGPTESTTFTCCHTVSRPPVGSVPIGRPIANTRVHLFDTGLEPVPVGVPGELYIGGDGLARGYLGQPGRTAERFVPHPCGEASGERLYRTGDLARLDADGVIEFLGRTDHQVKLRGFRVELGEIESSLAATPGVAEAVVVARDADAGDRELVAYLVLEGDAGVQDARELLRKRLPEYMVPARFVLLDSLPLNANGKVDRGALPAPGPEESATDYEPPRTPVEEVIAAIWSAVLEEEKVGLHDNFFDLGGHSLRATQVMSRLRDALGVGLPVRTLFERPTVESLARRVSAERTTPTTAIGPPVAVLRDRPSPLSLAQQGLWVLARLAPDSPVYNVPAAL